MSLSKIIRKFNSYRSNSSLSFYLAFCETKNLLYIPRISIIYKSMRKLKEKNKYENKPKNTHTKKNKQQKQKTLSHYYSKDNKTLCTYVRRLFYSSVSSEQKHNTTIISHFSSLYFIWICFKGEMEGKNEERQQSGKRKIEGRQEFFFSKLDKMWKSVRETTKSSHSSTSIW